MKLLHLLNTCRVSIKNSAGFHNAMVFLVFVAIAVVFWIIMAINDSVQKDFTVKIDIVNVPDSVTFIDEPPLTLHVTVRDRGSSLLRNAGFRTPSMHVNFRDYASDGVFRFTPSDLNASLKTVFGKSAAVLSVSLDSLRLAYTSSPGKVVPVLLVSDFQPAPGSVIAGNPKCNPSRVTVYGPQEILDTMTRVMTEKIGATNLKESTTLMATILRQPSVRILPARVEVSVKVEPLVRKETTVDIKTINVPEGRTLILFPSSVKVTYYVPMSRFNDDVNGISVVADYASLSRVRGTMLPIYLGGVPRGLMNPELTTDSVEYSVVR